MLSENATNIDLSANTTLETINHVRCFAHTIDLAMEDVEKEGNRNYEKEIQVQLKRKNPRVVPHVDPDCKFIANLCKHVRRVVRVFSGSSKKIQMLKNACVYVDQLKKHNIPSFTSDKWNQVDIDLTAFYEDFEMCKDKSDGYSIISCV